MPTTTMKAEDIHFEDLLSDLEHSRLTIEKNKKKLILIKKKLKN